MAGNSDPPGFQWFWLGLCTMLLGLTWAFVSWLGPWALVCGGIAMMLAGLVIAQLDDHKRKRKAK